MKIPVMVCNTQRMPALVVIIGLNVNIKTRAQLARVPALGRDMQQRGMFVLCGILLNIRAVENFIVSSKFSASLFYQLIFSLAKGNNN